MRRVLFCIALVSSAALAIDPTAMPAGRSTGTKLRHELRCTEFEVNVPVPGRLFTMDALEIHAGSRIIDTRPDAKTRIYKPTLPGK